MLSNNLHTASYIKYGGHLKPGSVHVCVLHVPVNASSLQSRVLPGMCVSLWTPLIALNLH